MNMRNPVFSDKAFVKNSTPEVLNNLYGMPSATSVQMGRLTLDDVIVKTLLCFGVLLVAAVVGWSFPGLALVGAGVGFVLGLVNVFKKQVRPGLVLAYAAFQGLFVGGVSAFFESSYSGIVLQAVLATLCVFVTVLVLFANGKVRTSPRLTKMFFVAVVGYGLFCLVNFGLVLFGGLDAPFGLRSANIPGTGVSLGLVIGFLVILLASYSLVMDFEAIKFGVASGVARSYAWRAAFGLLVTMVWLYLELLRFIALLRE